MAIALQRAYQLWRHMGTHWVLYRCKHALQQRSGALKRKMPRHAWDAAPLANFLTDPRLKSVESYAAYRRNVAPPFFFDPSQRQRFAPILAELLGGESGAVHRADDCFSGSFRFFSHHALQTGSLPNWHHNYHSDQTAPADRHWSEIGDFGHGDIKWIWELSRFGFAYDLVRAYWRTGDERYPARFWDLFEDWRRHNPPQQGPNWKCGQEASLRVMAWCFALYGFANSPETTPQRLSQLAQAVAVTATRVAHHIDYGLSQRNNHGISEGVGLWTIGLLFPEFNGATAWRERGRSVLEALAQTLIGSDGAFVQHSMNYHRLMLHDYLWAIRLGDLCGHVLSDDLRQRIALAGNFLYQMQDEQSGELPAYGQDDGALILPLNDCDYRDDRPVVQAVFYLSHRERLLPAGAWDEDLLWLFGPEALHSSSRSLPRSDFAADDSGHYVLRGEHGFLFTRCATYRDRPSQADMLHADIWWRGSNIAIDPGTYSYNAPAPWNNPLAHTAYHNTVSVDDTDQMERISRFLWLPWLHCRAGAIRRSTAGHLAFWWGSHDGYARGDAGVTHRREIVQILDQWWLVCDELLASSRHRYRLHWLFNNFPHRWAPDEAKLRLQTPAGTYDVLIAADNLTAADNNLALSMVSAADDNPRGWRARYYGSRQPALSVDAVASGQRMRFVTALGPDLQSVRLDATQVTVTGDEWSAAIDLTRPNANGTPRRARLTATTPDEMTLH